MAEFSTSTVTVLLYQAKAQGNRIPYVTAISRERAEKAIYALSSLYSCHEGSASSVYAAMAAWEALGIDPGFIRFVKG